MHYSCLELENWMDYSHNVANYMGVLQQHCSYCRQMNVLQLNCIKINEYDTAAM
jgi:hypothetical protein